jgi:branched-chain amino acid transport system substrate-binding protein
MWEEDVNAKGGLLGRPVKFVIYDDQSTPANVPSIYSKLLDVDKVDLIFSGYGTGVQSALLPLAMQRNKVFVGNMGAAVNATINYERFFQIQPAGPDAKTMVSRGFFEVAMSMNPKPKTVALVGSDAEFSQRQQAGAREIANSLGLQIVYDKSFPPNTVDLSSVVRVIKAANPDIVWVATYPPETVAFLRAARDIGLAPAILGGGMVGVQQAALKLQLGPLLNGIVNYTFYAPEPTLKFPGTDEFVRRYQERAVKAGTDQLGFYVPPLIYSSLQVLASAITEAKSLDDGKLAEIMRAKTFDTIVGPVKFGVGGEWEKSRVLFTQLRNVHANDIDQFRNAGVEVIVYPPEFKSGEFLYPYSSIKRN